MIPSTTETTKSKKKKTTSIREQVTRVESLGTKVVQSKDILDSDIPLFTTQRKRILEYAKESELPSKFIFPVYESEKQSHHPSDISLDLESILQYIQRNQKQSIRELVDGIRKVQPKITEPEALFFISEIVPNDESFEQGIQQISSTYANMEVFINEKNNWMKIEFPKLMERDQIDLKNLSEYFDFLIEDLPPIRVSDMTISKMTIEFDILLKNPDEQLIQISPDLFAQMKTSYDIPFIQYNDFQFKKYKVYSGETFETRPPFKLFENRFVKFDEKNMLYLILLSDPSPNISEYTKSSYIPAQIDLEKNVLSFKYFVLYNRPEKDIVLAIEKLLPQIQLVNRREKNYGAFFNIYDTVIREDSFLDLLTNEPFSDWVAVEKQPKLFSGVLFTDESEKPISEKKKLKIYYDTNIGFEEQKGIEVDGRERKDELSKMSSLGFYMTQYDSGQNDSEISKGRYTITEFDEKMDHSKKLLGLKETLVKSLFLPLNTPFITVTISKAVNRFVLFQFMNVYARLLYAYNQLRNDIELEYNELIPELLNPNIQEEELSLILKPKKKIGKERIGKIQLSTIAPEIFTKSYSRDCQYSQQPILIPDTDVDLWKNKKIKDQDNKMIERPVKSLGDYYFVCPTEENPFVEFKQNLDEDRKFDFYPCCYMSEQKEIRVRERGKTFRDKDPIKTNKVMAEGGLATIPTSIEEMLKGAFEEPLSFYRMGSYVSPNSILACICLAMEDKRFINLKSDDAKNQYLIDLRINIGNHGNFLTTSSELFDVSEKDRIENFKKIEEFLDPSLYYRVLEEVFDVNLFLFSGSKPKPNVEPIYSLEISRFSSIPIHSFKRSRPTILIYKHWGSETDHLEYPQCELIISRVQGKDALLYNEDIARYLLKGYFISSEVYGRIFLPSENIFENYSSYFLYEVLQRDFIGTFMNPKSPVHAIGQIIDEKGKLCGLQLKTPKGKMTMGVPPLPPQNLPMITKIETPNLEDVLKIFKDKPTGFSYENGKVNAVWFKLLTMEYGIQVPIQPVSENKVPDLPSVPENRFVLKQKQSQIQRLFKLQKDVNMIVQLIRWIYLVSIEDQPDLTMKEKIELANDFLKEIVLMVPRTNPDSSKDYDFSKLPRNLPNAKQRLNFTSFDDILQTFVPYETKFTDGKNIFIYGDVFYQRIKESLIHYIRLNLPLYIPEYLDGFYESVFDYPIIPKTLIFLSEIDFKRWLSKAIEDPTSTYPVLYSLKTKLNEMKGPYLYSIEKTKPSLNNPFGQNLLFIIQNVPTDNGKVNALENAKIWKEKQINHPMLSESEITEFKNYKVFTISSTETLELLEDNSDTNDLQNTLFILKYPNFEIYASILPM
jgi:hypothetical protein